MVIPSTKVRDKVGDVTLGGDTFNNKFLTCKSTHNQPNGDEIEASGYIQDCSLDAELRCQ